MKRVATATEKKIITKSRGVVKTELVEDDNPLIRKFVDFYVEEWKRAHPGDKNPREWFYVSDVGRCPRSIYYQFYNADKKREMQASTIMMFKFGDLFHEEAQRAFRALGFTTSKDIEFGTWSKVGFMKRGRLDVLVDETWVTPAMKVVTEIKSKSSIDADEPPDPEVDQLMSYMADCRNNPYFKSKKIQIREWGYLFYVDRSGFSEVGIKAWRIHYSEDRVKTILREFRALHRAIKRKLIPLRPYTRDSLQCGYCRFQDFCWEDVPRPAEPELEKDESVPVPAMEIVESQASAYIRLKSEIKVKEKELELAEMVLEQHFKSSGTKTLDVGGIPINYELYNYAHLNVPYLLEKLKAKWYLIAVPQVGLLREAVKNGIVDGETFERAFEFEVRSRIKIGKPAKGESK